CPAGQCGAQRPVSHQYRWAYGGPRYLEFLSKPISLSQKSVHGGVEVCNRFCLTPAVSFSGVDVILVRHPTAGEGGDHSVRLRLGYRLVDLSLKQRNGVTDTVSGKQRRALAVHSRSVGQRANEAIQVVGLELVRGGRQGEQIGDAVEADRRLKNPRMVRQGLQDRIAPGTATHNDQMLCGSETLRHEILRPTDRILDVIDAPLAA